MRLIIKTNNKNLYSVHLPNYIDMDHIDPILIEAKEALPVGVEYKSHHIWGDGLCDDERKQIDYYGMIKYPIIPLTVNT
jgi:hypothetical protein